MNRTALFWHLQKQVGLVTCPKCNVYDIGLRVKKINRHADDNNGLSRENGKEGVYRIINYLKFDNADRNFIWLFGFSFYYSWGYSL